jgi:glutathione S-transferase/GST-like protein
VKIDLYTWEPNSNSGKAFFALCEKNAQFDFHYVDMLKFQQHDPEYLARNPAGTLPTLVVDGKVFTESTQICEFISEALPGPGFVPKDPYERYLMRWWAANGSAWSGSLSVLGWSRLGSANQRSKEEQERIIARIPTKERRIAWTTAMSATFTEKQLEDAREGVRGGIRMMNQRLSETKAYFAGATFSVADIAIFANAYRIHLQFPETANDQVSPYYMDWLRRIYARPATPKAFAYSRGQIGQQIPGIMNDLGVSSTAH